MSDKPKDLNNLTWDATELIGPVSKIATDVLFCMDLSSSRFKCELIDRRLLPVKGEKLND